MLPTNEFAREVIIDPWPEGGLAVELRAEPEERERLARRFGLLGLASLEATGRLERDPASGEIRLRGWLEATLEQECVVSLEPVPAQIRQPLERRWLRVDGQRPAPAEPAVWTFDDDAADEDEVELLPGRTLDLGEAIAEELALALDPYPRAPDADALVARDLGPYISFGDTRAVEPPFAVLRQLKEKRVR